MVCDDGERETPHKNTHGITTRTTNIANQGTHTKQHKATIWFRVVLSVGWFLFLFVCLFVLVVDVFVGLFVLGCSCVGGVWDGGESEIVTK